MVVDGTKLYERAMAARLRAAGATARRVPFAHGDVHALDLVGQGSLPPVALLHGFSASGPAQFVPMATRLRHHVRRLILPDLPGHGLSSVPVELTAEVLEQGLFAALDRLVHPERPVVLFASSLSGGLSVRYAARHPERVAGLMLCSPGGIRPTTSELADLSSALSVDSHRKALAFVDRAMAVPRTMRHAYAWGVRRQFSRPHLQRLIARVDEQPFLDEAEIAALKMPVHIIWGGRDGLLPARHLQVFRDLLGDRATVETPEAFCHAPFLHHADELVVRLVRFARRCSKPPNSPAAPVGPSVGEVTGQDREATVA